MRSTDCCYTYDQPPRADLPGNTDLYNGPGNAGMGKRGLPQRSADSKTSTAGGSMPAAASGDGRRPRMSLCFQVPFLASSVHMALKPLACLPLTESSHLYSSTSSRLDPSRTENVTG